MCAIGDLAQFQYVSDKLFEPGQYSCPSNYGGDENFSLEVMYGNMCMWSPTDSSCSGKSDGAQRLCCCGNGMCPLED